MRDNGIEQSRFDQQFQIAIGQLSPKEYLSAGTSFYDPAQYLNRTLKKGDRVALFDEVFGYFLDVPYFWANPGHTTELGYDKMDSGDDFVKALKAKGIDYVYVNLHPPGTNFRSPEAKRWSATLGLEGPPIPYDKDEWEKNSPDLNWRAKAVLGEAIADGWLKPDNQFGSRIVFKVMDQKPPEKM